MGLAWGNNTCHDQRGGWIDAEMDLSVGASLLPLDGREPCLGASDLQAGGIDPNAASTLRPVRQDQVPAPAAQGGRIGSRRSHSGERENRAHEADGWPKRQAITLLQEQSQQDDLVRVDDGMTPVCRSVLAASGPLGA